jgi:phage terminase large subunit-like protein
VVPVLDALPISIVLVTPVMAMVRVVAVVLNAPLAVTVSPLTRRNRSVATLVSVVPALTVSTVLETPVIPMVRVVRVDVVCYLLVVVCYHTIRMWPNPAVLRPVN